MKLEEIKPHLVEDMAAVEGIDPQQAERFIEALAASLWRIAPGALIYNSKPCQLPMDQIRKAMADGESMRSIEKRFHVDRRTIYRRLDDPDC